MVVDTSANGALLANSYNEAYEILERIPSNNLLWSNTRAPIGRKVVSINEVDTFTSLVAQISSMSTMLKNISMNLTNGNSMGQHLD